MKCGRRCSRFASLEGFTLVEVVIAIGIVTTVMIPMVILLGYGIGNAGDITARDRALRLVPAIEVRLNSGDFSEVQSWGSAGGQLFAYVYRAVPASGAGADGGGSATTGNDVFVAIARSTREAGDIAAEVSSIEGHMFRVDLQPVAGLVASAGNGQDSRMLSSGREPSSVELDAHVSRVLNPLAWRSSKVEPRVSLRFVINR